MVKAGGSERGGRARDVVRVRLAARTGDIGVVTVTVCDSKQGTDESVRGAADWIRTNMSAASVSPPEISEGETYINF